MLDTLSRLQDTDFAPLMRGELRVLQVNLGYRCNQRCVHCHVNAGPTRKEVMSDTVVDQVMDFLTRARLAQLDLTGGAPEMHPRFRELVGHARGLGIEVIDRCNLTILEEPGYEDMASFLASRQVQIVASLPCYLEKNVDAQRGSGVFQTSLRALRKLNALGYGRGNAGLELNLVYNPTGDFLPPAQQALEEEYKRQLAAEYGIVFNRLFTITNMPIRRFGGWLLSHGRFDAYMQLLRDAHREENRRQVMCRELISVDWQGYLHDCDFNQMLGLPLGGDKKHISRLDVEDLPGKPIMVLDHCYACTAGQGSSCSGAL